MIFDGNQRQFLYEQIREYLIRELRSGRLGGDGRIPSERKLAEELQVSRETLRSALARLENSGFIERIPCKGAFVRQDGKPRRVSLCLIFPEESMDMARLSFANYHIVNQYWHGIMSFTNRREVDLVFVHCPEQLADVAAFGERIVDTYDGAFFFGGQLLPLRRWFQNRSFPYAVLGIGAQPEEVNIRYDERIQSEVVEALWRHGARNVDLLAFEGAAESDSLQHKMQALQQGLARHGVEWDERRQTVFFPDSESEAECCARMEALYLRGGRPLPDAFFCSTPLLGFGLLDFSLRHRYRLAQDYRVVGYDHHERLRQGGAGFWYVRLPHFEIGFHAAELLCSMVRGNSKIPREKLIAATFVGGDAEPAVSMEPIEALAHV